MKTRPNRAIGKCLAIVIFLSATVVNAQADRAEVPSSEQQQTRQKLLQEGFGLSKAATNTEKQKLVKRLMQEAVIDPKLPKDDLFVVLPSGHSTWSDISKGRVSRRRWL